MNQHLDKDNNPEMLEEYDFSGDVRGKYATRFAEGANVVVLRFRELLETVIRKYVDELQRPESTTLRRAFRKKMNYICRI